MTDDLCALAISAIRTNPHTKQLSVRVSSSDKCLVLDGTVHSYYQKQMAQEVIMRVGGIVQIRNDVEVARG